MGFMDLKWKVSPQLIDSKYKKTRTKEEGVSWETSLHERLVGVPLKT